MPRVLEDRRGGVAREVARHEADLDDRPQAGSSTRSYTRSTPVKSCTGSPSTSL